MRIGLIDVDGHNFPNLPLMKLSAWHKQARDHVAFSPTAGDYDRLYMSKVFTDSREPQLPTCSEIERSGTGYYFPKGGPELPPAIEHIYPDYTLYPEHTKDKAFGFLTRGCPRCCKFCGVWIKEGKKSIKVADLSEFWRGQKESVLLDPNITACADWKPLFQQLISSYAWVDFTQGLDMRLMTAEKAELLKQMQVKQIHFAWDNYNDKNTLVPKFKEFKKVTGWDCRKMGVFVLTNFDSTHEEDLERVYMLRDMGYWPYVMIYDKLQYVDTHGGWLPDVQDRFTTEQLRHFKTCQHLQRWSGNRKIFHSCRRFQDYERYQTWMSKGKPVPVKNVHRQMNMFDDKLIP